MSGRGNESTRQFRARFCKCIPLDVSRSKWAMARRLAQSRFRRTRGALGVRSYQALNVMGLRIWVDKPRQFGGKKWRANCATVQRSIDRARGLVFSPRRKLYAPVSDRLCVTAGDGWPGNLDAPGWMVAGCMYRLSFVAFQAVVVRAGELNEVPF